MDLSVDNETLIAVRCVGLNVSPKTTFKNVGVLSNIFLRATGTKNATNEKRTLKMSQSAPYRPGGRPPNADPTQFYVSEVFEDIVDVTPSLVASIRCPADMDCTIRLSVYYSSNLTGEKDVLLAGTSFSRKEVLRAVQGKGVFLSDMISEYCPGSKAFVEVIEHMPNVLPDVATVLPSADPAEVQRAADSFLGFDITGQRSPVNPFKQRYLFYGEQDQYQPLVDAEESTWEPHFSAQVSAMFLENFTAALMRSINAWNMRYELERKRQGRFRSLKEAQQHGWHSVNVTVLEARIGGTRAQRERLRAQQLQAEAAQEAAQAGIAAGNGPGGSARASNRFSTNLAGRNLSTAPGAGANGAGPPLPLYNICIPFYEDSGRVEVGDGHARGNRRVLHDESAPSTFVEMSLRDESQVFLMPLGRTNTEFFTMNPVYGSNLHQNQGRKSSLVPQAGADNVEICFADKARSFYSYDTTDRDAVTRWHHLQHQQIRHAQLSASAAAEGVDASYASASSSSTHSSSHSQSHSHSGALPSRHASQSRDNAAQAQLRQLSAAIQSALPLPLPPADAVQSLSVKEAHFYRFVSTCTNVSLLLEVCVEDPSSGQRRRVGTCTLPLSAGCRVDTWLPVKPDSGADGDLLEDVEVHVLVSVKSPFDEDSAIAPEAELHVGGSPSDKEARAAMHRDYFCTKPSPACMPETFLYQRSIQGPPEKDADGNYPWDNLRARSSSQDAVEGTGTGKNVPWSTLSDEKLNELSDYRASIANAYEWMWFAGFNGLDPLIVDDAAMGARSKDGKSAAAARAAAAAAAAAGDANPRPVSTGFSNEAASARGATLSVDKPGSAALSSVSEEGSRGRTASSVPATEDDPLREDNGDHGDEEELANFDEHFGSSRMSVFECSPTVHGADAAGDPSSGEFPLDAQQMARQMAATADGGATVFGDFAPQGDAESPSPIVAGAKSPQSAAQEESAAPYTPSPRRVAYYKRSRVDFPYPLEWIREHVTAMEQLAMELGSLVPMLKQAHRDNKSFRASALKKQAEWQPLPVNLHYQLMAVRPHTSTPAQGVRTEVIHSVTCGAMTPHMLGHKNGGLYYQESKLVGSKMELDRSKQLYAQRVAMAGGKCIPTAASEPYGIHKRLKEIGDKTLKFESLCLSICHRRAYAISQALSIAVNSLLLKLGLALQGVVPDRVCEQWMSCGILLVFEGLLSVVAHERSMLEDTISAVDALKSFQVRLLPYADEMGERPASTPVSGSQQASTAPSPAFGIAAQEEGDSAPAARPTPPPKPPRPLSMKPTALALGGELDLSNINLNLNINADALSNHSSNSASQNSTPRPPLPPKEAEPSDPTASAPFSPQRKLKLEMKGREVLIYVPASSLRRFPQSYQKAAYSGGAVIPFYCVLFTQGIDIQQTMVTTFGGDTSKGRTNNLHLQHDVNLKGLRDINAYSLKALPVSVDTGTAVHAVRGNSSTAVAAGATGAPTVVDISAARRASVRAQMLTHPMVKTLQDTILSSSLTLKNVDLLIEVERLTVMLGGCRVTFCKSGKDRTGMACTLEQSRQLGERYGCGMAVPRILKDANLMRVHGCRLLIAEKNIGRKVYSINKLQAQFLPVMFRPPNQVCEDMMKKDNS